MGITHEDNGDEDDGKDESNIHKILDNLGSS
jgi:hypothetical protein